MPLPNKIQEALEIHEKKRQQILECTELTIKVEEAIEKSGIKDRIRFTDIRFEVGSVPGVCLHINDLDSFKDAVPLIIELRKFGYKIKSHVDYPEIRRRWYKYEDPNLNVLCFLTYKKGASCQFVQVGVKEEPVYRLMCAEK